MIVPDGTDDEKKSAPDYSGMIKVATAIVVGILTVVGFGLEDIFGKKTKSKKSDQYDDLYLDEEVSNEELNKKDFEGDEESSNN